MKTSFSRRNLSTFEKDSFTTQVVPNPEILDLGLGQPSPSLLPIKKITSHFVKEVQSNENCWKFLQYGFKSGAPRFRESLSTLLSSQGSHDVQPAEIMVNAGASAGISQLCSLYSGPGDIIMVENPTYFLTLGIFRELNLQIVGFNWENVEETIQKTRPKLLYTIPVYQNPMGTSLSADQKKYLVTLAQKYNFRILADEVYQLLYYGEKPVPGLVHYDSEEDPRVISIGSFSKIMGPGLRLGWFEAKKKLIDRISSCGIVNSGGSLNHFTSGVMNASLEAGFQLEHLRNLRLEYSDRSSELFQALKNDLPAGRIRSISVPKGGYFVWVELDRETDQKFERELIESKVGVKRGSIFSPDGKFGNCIRLSFSYYSKEELKEASRRLAEALKRW